MIFLNVGTSHITTLYRHAYVHVLPAVLEKILGLNYPNCASA